MSHGRRGGRGRALSAVAVAVCAVIAACTSPSDGRGAVVDLVVEKGGTRAQGECIADGFEQQFGDLRKDWSEYDREDGAAALRSMLTCFGMDPAATGLSDCFYRAVVSLSGDGKNMAAIFDTVASLDADGHRTLAVATLMCQGADVSAAECIVDMAITQLGPEAFDADLSGERRARIAEFARTCAG